MGSRHCLGLIAYRQVNEMENQNVRQQSLALQNDASSAEKG